MKKVLSLMMMTLLCVAAWAGEKTDVITAEGLGISGSAYQAFTGKSFTSDAVYAGTISGNNDDAPMIQLNSNRDAIGIVSTVSGGKLKSVTVTFNEKNDRKSVNIFGKNTAYAKSDDLSDRSTRGEQLGSVSEVSTSQTVEVTGDYEYVGIRANSGAVYIDKIEIVWTVEDAPAEPAITFSPEAGEVEKGTQVTVTATNVPEGMKLFTCQGENGNWTQYGNHTYTINADGVIRAFILDAETDTYEISWYTTAGTKAEAAYTVKAEPAQPEITFNPAAGEVEAGTQVTITAANVPAGMKLFTCQDNGSWSKYITSYTINAASTLRAAILDENTDDTEISWYMINGTKAEAAYTIKVAPVVEPKIVFSVEAGEVEAGTEVTISAEGIDYDYTIKATYNDQEKEGKTVTFTLNETGSVIATIWKWSDNLDDYTQTNISGSARYTVVAPEAEPVITLTPNGGEFQGEVDVVVDIENLPNDASVYCEFEKADGTTTGEMMLQNGKYTVTESGYLTVKVVREAAEEAPMAKAPKTGTLAQIKSDYYTINEVPTGIEALTAGKAVKGIRYFNVAGQQAAAAFQGVNIVVVDYQDGTQAVTKVVK